MVRLVIETPLADNQIGASVLHPDLRTLARFYNVTKIWIYVSPLDHVQKLLLLVLSQLLVFLHALNIQLVFRLRPRRFKGTSQNSNLGVSNNRRHLGMRHVLVDDDTLDEGSILERASDFAVDLDEFKVDVAALEVCN